MGSRAFGLLLLVVPVGRGVLPRVFVSHSLGMGQGGGANRSLKIVMGPNAPTVLKAFLGPTWRVSVDKHQGVGKCDYQILHLDFI